MSITLETLIFAHMFYYTAAFYLLSRFAPYIPTPEGGGFTALFDKYGTKLLPYWSDAL